MEDEVAAVSLCCIEMSRSSFFNFFFFFSSEKQLVIDNGSGMCKAGFAGDDAPRAVSNILFYFYYERGEETFKRGARLVPLLLFFSSRFFFHLVFFYNARVYSSKSYFRSSPQLLVVPVIKVLWLVWAKRIHMLVMKHNPREVS